MNPYDPDRFERKPAPPYRFDLIVGHSVIAFGEEAVIQAATEVRYAGFCPIQRCHVRIDPISKNLIVNAPHWFTKEIEDKFSDGFYEILEQRALEKEQSDE